MYALLFTFKLGPNMRPAAEQIADQSFPGYKSMKGFKSATYLGEDESGEYAALSIWESKEDLDAATEIMRPKTEEALANIVKEPPVRKVYEVYEPKQ
ncbi:antibiotic biosynthesis monooxygenase family protein [Chloroflexota bacterium]